jgi:hypothetical protein
VIKFVSDLQQVGGFLWIRLFLPPIKHNITKISSKAIPYPFYNILNSSNMKRW